MVPNSCVTPAMQKRVPASLQQACLEKDGDMECAFASGEEHVSSLGPAQGQSRGTSCSRQRSTKDQSAVSRTGSGWLQVGSRAGSSRIGKHRRSMPKGQLSRSITGNCSFSMVSQHTPLPLSSTEPHHPSSTPPLRHRACTAASCDLTACHVPYGLCDSPTSFLNYSALDSPEQAFDSSASLLLRPPLGPSAFDCTQSPAMPFNEPATPPRPAAPFHDPDSPSYTAVLPLPDTVAPPLHAPEAPALPDAHMECLSATQNNLASSIDQTKSAPMLPPNPHACPHGAPPSLPADAAPADAAYSRRCQNVLKYMRTHSAASIRKHVERFPDPDAVMADLSHCCMHGLWEELQATLQDGPDACTACSRGCAATTVCA
eukprot:jgi/Ulvmu1/3885/UM018_0106.1